MSLIYNPILPLNEYIPDGEPHVFNNRLYIFGSHDLEDGRNYCLGDYVAYSCPINDLSDWRYDGVIYRKTQDPYNKEGKYQLYAPDVVLGFDGRYYLYYALNAIDEISIAVSNNPEGPYEYYGIVQYKKGINKKDLEHYPYNFDPSILMDNGHLYLTIGFSLKDKIPDLDLNEKNTKGGYVVELDKDMKTMIDIPKLVIPGINCQDKGNFKNHEFLEASSLRKFNNKYYYIYSSQNQHELCYAISDYVDHDYVYGGILISNAGKLNENMIYENNYANNHGSIVKVNDNYYIFYHRHTYGFQFSRQACAEKIILDENNHFIPTLNTSLGLNLKPLPINKTYPSSICCGLYDGNQGCYIGFNDQPLDKAYITKDGIIQISNTTVIYRYFESITNQLILNVEGNAKGYIEIFNNTELLTKKDISINKKNKITIELKPQDITWELIIKFHLDNKIILKEIGLYNEKK